MLFNIAVLWYDWTKAELWNEREHAVLDSQKTTIKQKKKKNSADRIEQDLKPLSRDSRSLFTKAQEPVMKELSVTSSTDIRLV